MFRINAQQHEWFLKKAMDLFAANALSHLRAELPHIWVATIDNTDGLDAVWEGIDLARAAGLEAEQDILRFLELWSIVGEAIDTAATQESVIQMLAQDTSEPEWRFLRPALVSICQDTQALTIGGEPA